MTKILSVTCYVLSWFTRESCSYGSKSR